MRRFALPTCLALAACGGPDGVPTRPGAPGLTDTDADTDPGSGDTGITPEGPELSRGGWPLSALQDSGLAACDAPGPDLPGGLLLRLDSGPWAAGSLVDLTVSGATPGDLVRFEIGVAGCDACATFAGGACRVAVDPTDLGEAVADPAGVVAITAVLPADLPPDTWLVLQAWAPDAALPYASQPLFDHVGNVARLPGPAFRGNAPAQPATVRNAWQKGGGRHDGEAAAFQVPAGRTTDVVAVFDADFLGLLSYTGEITDQYRDDRLVGWSLEPELATVWVMYDYTETGDYDYDVVLSALPEPVPWYVDADADGFGDPGGDTVLSASPVLGRSSDPRDCDDAASAIHPGGLETCDDGVDEDCDGGDRPCDAGSGVAGLTLAGTFVWSGGDAAWTHPVAVESDGTPGEELFVAPGLLLDNPWTSDREDPAMLLPGERGAASGDLTGDGVADLLISGYGTRVLEGPVTDGRTELPVASLPPAWEGVAVGDVDGDGIDDAVLALEGTAAWYRGPLARNPPADATWADSGDQATTVDADGDGDDDVWIGDCFYRSPILPAAEPERCLDVGVAAGAITTGDVDGDGIEEIALASQPSGVSVGPATGGTHVEKWRTAWADGTGVLVRGPDHAWLVAGGLDGRLAVYDPRAGALTPDLAERTFPDAGAESLAAIDADGDGIDELAGVGPADRAWVPTRRVWLLGLDW